MGDIDDAHAWNEKQAAELVGAKVLIGLTRFCDTWVMPVGSAGHRRRSLQGSPRLG